MTDAQEPEVLHKAMACYAIGKELSTALEGLSEADENACGTVATDLISQMMRAHGDWTGIVAELLACVELLEERGNFQPGSLERLIDDARRHNEWRRRRER